MLIDAGSVQGPAARLVAAGERLVALGVERRAASLARAASLLGARAREPLILARLAESSGLTEPMVRWAMETTLESVDASRLEALGRAALEAGLPRAEPVPARLCAVVLSGNVLTASVRASLVPLLVGAPVLAKASSRDDALPRLLLECLEAEGDALGGAFDVVTLPGDSPEVASFFDQADAIAVYGSDATVRAVRAAAPASAEVVAHGHGLGVAYVDGVPASDDALAALARALGEDVAAYDQRGCLSPHAVFVRGDAREAARLAEALFAALATLAVERPRGRLSIEAGSAQLQWRGVAAARGALFEGEGFAVSDEGDGALRLSPGYRNVAVLRCEGPDVLARALAPLGVHLKALGVGGETADAGALARSLPAPLAPRVSPLGAMQRPPLDALADGRPATYGLVRYVEADVRRR